MKYMSTRGRIRNLSFKDAVMMGLADDGGLLLPESIPQLSANELAALEKLPYPQLAFELISKFVGDIPADDLKELIDRSYGSFSHPDITPVVHWDDIHILELFHGPTLAFKDVALQFLGNLFEYLLKERKQKMNILGATSGDTGSAAIHGVRGKENINIFILHPYQKVSPIQELQMTTVTDPNVYNLAIRGTFDDGQKIVKETFGDLEFKAKYALGAVNSINWARVLAQVVYYFYAWGQVRRRIDCRQIRFSVPTGNFGDIFAGYVAKMMGLPISQLILATNENNILSRFVCRGDYSIGQVVPTLSPSMDIQLASNFERYLFYLYGEQTERVREAMDNLAQTGKLSFDASELNQVANDFLGFTVDDRMTLETIRSFHEKNGYLLDPHTAVGVRAAREVSRDDTPVVCLATAHPAKFGEAVRQAIGSDPPLPPSLVDIHRKEKRCRVVPAETEVVKSFIAEHALQ
ncbi:MAG: threonine synthase [Desulfuromonadaceae bacterium]|jgi:threonine synthase